MADNNNKNSIGCLIVFGLAALGLLSFYLSTMEKEEFTELGLLVMMGASIAIVVLVVRYIAQHSSKKLSDLPWKFIVPIIIGIFIFLGMVFQIIGTDEELNTGIGVAVFIIIFIAAACWLWISMHE